MKKSTKKYTIFLIAEGKEDCQERSFKLDLETSLTIDEIRDRIKSKAQLWCIEKGFIFVETTGYPKYQVEGSSIMHPIK